jgi:hypothetical protein
MSALSDEQVVELFGGLTDAKDPRFAVGGGAADDNTVDGYAVGDEFGRAMQDAVYRTDLSVYKSMEGGRRRKRQTKRKSRKGRKQRGGSKKQPRFQLSMKATIRLQKKQKQRQ